MKINRIRLTSLMVREDIKNSKELAVAAGISVNTVSRLMNGATAKVPTIGKLAAALNCEPAELLEGA